jgi:hypothetical protein
MKVRDCPSWSMESAKMVEVRVIRSKKLMTLNNIDITQHSK